MLFFKEPVVITEGLLAEERVDKLVSLARKPHEGETRTASEGRRCRTVVFEVMKQSDHLIQ